MSAADAEAKKQAWHALAAAAQTYAGTGLGSTGAAAAAQGLAEAAVEWARAKGWREPRAEGAPQSGAVLPPFGRQKGQPIAGAETADLRWYAGALQRSIDDESKARWRDANQAVLDAIETELEGRQ